MADAAEDCSHRGEEDCSSPPRMVNSGDRDHQVLPSSSCSQQSLSSSTSRSSSQSKKLDGSPAPSGFDNMRRHDDASSPAKTAANILDGGVDFSAINVAPWTPRPQYGAAVVPPFRGTPGSEDERLGQLVSSYGDDGGG